MKTNGFEADESAAIETAGYDAPFIPGPLRRERSADTAESGLERREMIH